MEYGKFNSAEELLKGYNELEKSFTQKCQQLAAVKELLHEQQKVPQNEEHADGTNAEASPSQAAAVSAPEEATAPVASQTDSAPATPDDGQLQQYLEEHPEVLARILQQKTPAAPDVMTGGGNVSLALPSRPKTIKEASLMAKDLFSGNLH